MSGEKREAQQFMAAYNGLKSAAKALEDMARQQEPDLDHMLVEVKNAKMYYDQCSEVIEGIKTQVEMLLGDSKTRETTVEVAEVRHRMIEQGRPQRVAAPPEDDDIPF